MREMCHIHVILSIVVHLRWTLESLTYRSDEMMVMMIFPREGTLLSIDKSLFVEGLVPQLTPHSGRLSQVSCASTHYNYIVRFRTMTPLPWASKDEKI